jgi:Tol biopolymer transport system component
MEKNKVTILKLLAGASIVIILSIAINFFYSQQKLKNVIDKQNAVFNSATGTLVYALSKEPQRVTDLYKYNLETKEETKIFNETQYIKFTPEQSPDGKKIAYAAALIDLDSKFLYPYSELLQIFVYDNITNKAEQITFATSTFRNQTPRWSPNGRYLLYYGYSIDAWSNNLPVNEPDNWFVCMYDTKTKENKVITRGLEGAWDPSDPSSNAFFYIRNDGLHVKNIKTNDDQLLVDLTSFAYVSKTTGLSTKEKGNHSMSLGISYDGRKLAWSLPGYSRVELYKIIKYPTYSLKKIYKLKTDPAEIYHPTFSPDGNFLAVQETEYPVDRVKVKSVPGDQLSLPQINFTNPRIVIYDLKTYKAKKIRDLTGYDFYGSALSQWVR